LEISVELVSCRNSRRPCSIKSPPASQVEALDVEILLSSQGSGIVNMEKSSIVYSFLVCAHNLQTLRIEQGSTLRIESKLFGYASLCCYRKRKALYLELFSFFSLPINSLDRWTLSATVSRPCDAMMSPRHIFRSRARDAKTARVDHCRASCCLHQIPGWSNDRYSPVAVIKGNPFTQNRRCKSSIYTRARHYHCSCSSSS
jgi:hypothetical protein